MYIIYFVNLINMTINALFRVFMLKIKLHCEYMRFINKK